MTITTIPAGDTMLTGDLSVPEPAAGVVVFSHDDPRDRAVAEALNQRSLATLVVDGRTGAGRGDVDLLADRLIGVIDWLQDQPGTAELPIGLFGVGIDGGAALLAAAGRPDAVRAVVSRGGRPDLAGRFLTEAQAPTLLIVGERDAQLRELNEQAREVMRTRAELCVIPDATQRFVEPGALEQVAREAGDWFATHLTHRQGSKIIDVASGLTGR